MISITITTLVSILLHSHAVSSRLLLNLWHSKDPELKVHFYLLESKSHVSLVSCPWWLPTSSTHLIPPKVTCAQSLAWCLCNRKLMSMWVPPTRLFYACVTLFTNHQLISVITCAQTTWSLTKRFPNSADHNPRWIVVWFQSEWILVH